MLAALSNSPSMYDPIKPFSDALNKRNKIIENFYNNGYITEEEKEDAIAEPLNIIEKEGKEGFQTYQSTYAIHCAALKLMEADHFRFKYTFSSKEEYDIYIGQYEKAYNEKTDEIKSGGYSIYTSFDSAIQEKLQNNDVAALSIGGFTNGVRVVDMVKGYQTLANLGQYTDRTCIVDIRDSNGNSVINGYKPDKEQVYAPDSAYMMTDILKGTIEQPFGTGRGLGLDSGMPSAGKTGTTNNNKDTWFCGYTRYYTTAVWVGYDIPREMSGIFGSTYSGRIWKNGALLQIKGNAAEIVRISEYFPPVTVSDGQTSDAPFETGRLPGCHIYAYGGGCNGKWPAGMAAYL